MSHNQEVKSDAQAPSASTGRRVNGLALLLIGVAWLALFTIRLAGPADFLTRDQDKPTAYILDILHNGNWICQHDVAGHVASKPPMYPWLAAVVSLALGGPSRFSIYMPQALAALALGYILYAFGRRYFGWEAGLLAALSYLLCATTAKQIALARTDGLFAAWVAVAALLAFRAWMIGLARKNSPKGAWVLFWLAAAAATLTKGPLGLALAAGGLLATFWERGAGPKAPVRGSHLPGVLLYLAIVLGWFGLAYLQEGGPLAQTLIGREILGHMIRGTRHAKGPGEGFYIPSVYFFTQFLPWSIFSLAAFWRTLARPSVEDATRRFERFLFCWFFLGLLIFSLASHQRVDLLSPLFPAAALLSGQEMSRWFAGRRSGAVLVTSALLAVLMLGVIAYIENIRRTEREAIAQTAWMKELAEHVRQKVGDQFPLVHTDNPFALQFYLNTMRQRVSFDQAAELLSGPEAAFVVVCDWGEFQKRLGPHQRDIHEVARRPTEGEAFVRIVSNHPRLEWTDRMAAWMGPILVQTDGLRCVRMRQNEFFFESHDFRGTATLTNRSNEVQSVRVRIYDGRSWTRLKHILGPEQYWRVGAKER